MSIKQYVDTNYTESQKEMFEYLVNSYPNTMLEDAEGNDYDDGYLTLALLAYVLGDTRSYITNLDTQMSLEELVSKIKNADLSYVNESINYGGTIYSIVADNTHIYVGGSGDQTVKKYLKSNLLYVGETPSYGGPIQSIAVDDTHIYAGGYTTQTVRRYLKSDLSYVDETPNYDGDIRSIVIDDTHVYVGGFTTNKVRKYSKSDLSYIGETPDSYGGNITSIAIDDTHIYVGGQATKTVKKYLKSNLTYAGETPSYGSDIYSIALDDKYIYAGGSVSPRVKRYLKSELSFAGESDTYGITLSRIYSIALDDTYIYAGGTRTNTVRKYLKTDLSYIGESANYGGFVLSMAADDAYIYAGGETTKTVRKYLKTDNNKLQNKKLLLLLLDFINVDLRLFNKSGEELLNSLVDMKQLALSYYDIMKNAGTKKAITQLFRAYSAYEGVDYEIEIVEDRNEYAVYIIADKLPEVLFKEADNKEYYVLKEDTLLYKLLSKIKPAGVDYLVIQEASMPEVVSPEITICEMSGTDDYQVKVTMTNEQYYPVSVDANVSMVGSIPIYVGGGAGRVKKYLKNSLPYKGQSTNYGGIINSIAIDDTYIYVGGSVTKTVRKYLKSDLSYIGQTPSYNGAIESIAVDDTHIYVGGSTPSTVKKYLKNDLSYAGETPSYGGTIYSMAVDDTHIYVGGGNTTRTVKKYLKSDMSYVGETPSYGGYIHSMAIDDTHIYVGGSTTQTVRRYLKSDLSYIDETPSYGAFIYSIAIDDTHVYVGGGTTNKVRKYSKIDLSYIGESVDYGSMIRSIAVDDTHIYVGGVAQKVKKYLKSNLSYAGETPSYGGIIYSIAIDDTVERTFIKTTIDGGRSVEHIVTSIEDISSIINVELTTSAVLKKPVTTTVPFDADSLGTCETGTTASPTVDDIECVTTPSSYGLSCKITNNDNTEVIVTIEDTGGNNMGTRTVSVGPNETITYQLVTGKIAPVVSYSFTVTAKSMYKHSASITVNDNDNNINCPTRPPVTASPTVGVAMCLVDTRGSNSLIVPITNNDDEKVTLIINGSTTSTTIDAGDTKNVNIVRGFVQNPYSYTFSLSAIAEGKVASPIEVYSGIVHCPIPVYQ